MLFRSKDHSWNISEEHLMRCLNDNQLRDMLPHQVMRGTYCCRPFLQPNRSIEWVWTPRAKQPPRARWDASDFCRLLGRRTLVVVGDSTFRVIFEVLVNTIAATGGDCYKQVAYKLSDLLAPRKLTSLKGRSHKGVSIEEFSSGQMGSTLMRSLQKY